MEEDVATDVVRRLERLGIDYYITGSEALARYGEPRQTADIDIVIQLPAHSSIGSGLHSRMTMWSMIRSKPEGERWLRW